MQRIIPPLLLVLALALMIAGFAVLTTAAPETPIDLHRARMAGDEQLSDALEADLHRRQRNRKLLIGGLFGGAGLAIVAAFLAMQPAEGRR